MADPSTTPLPLTGELSLDAITHGYYWDTSGSNTLYWSLSHNLPESLVWNNPQNTVQSLQSLFDVYEGFIDVDFVYAGFFDDPGAAYTAGSDINVSLYNDTVNLAWAYANDPNSALNTSEYPGAPGDAFLNIASAANSLDSYDPGSAGWFLMLHQLGHSLGLKHPHDDGGTGRPTVQQFGDGQFDTSWMTVMAYNDDYAFTGADINPETPMALDVLGLQSIYGANVNTNAGDNIHNITTTQAYETLWDAGGVDTLDASASNEGWNIALPSNIGVSDDVGYAIPSSEVAQEFPQTLYWILGEIESVTGSLYADRILGNEQSNTLNGGQGDDYLDGSQGIDIAVFSGNAAEYTIETGENSTFLTGPDGYDQVVNIERFSFDDGYRAIDHSGSGGQAYRLYQAAFDRTPDAAGVGFWMSKIDNGMSLEEAGSRFIDSDEFRSLYGSDATDYEFLEALYANVLDRAPDGDGFDWWLGQLDTNPDKTREKVLADFSESAENVANVYENIATGFAYDLWVV